MTDKDRPDAFIQWKGTDACLDLYCTCGEQFHFDGYFAYELTCGYCGQAYELPNTVRIHPVEPSRQLKLVFDGDWEGAPKDGYIRDGEFDIPWPQPSFGAAKPGETFEVYDEVFGGTRSAYVKFIRATPTEGGTMILTVQNTGLKP
jgi:hypothetical protein